MAWCIFFIEIIGKTATENIPKKQRDARINLPTLVLMGNIYFVFHFFEISFKGNFIVKKSMFSLFFQEKNTSSIYNIQYK